MLIACWSAKGGAGVTVVAATLAATLADHRPVLLVDLAGDAAPALGVAAPSGPGVAEWLAAGPDTPPDALARLEVEVTPTLRLLHPGRGPLRGPRAAVLARLLVAAERTVVVDCGRLTGADDLAARLATDAHRSLLVTRLCYLAIRRAQAAPVRPTGVVVVAEPHRALGVADLVDALGLPVVARVAVDSAVARAVDCGLLLSRRPRSLANALAAVA